MPPFFHFTLPQLASASYLCQRNICFADVLLLLILKLTSVQLTSIFVHRCWQCHNFHEMKMIFDGYNGVSCNTMLFQNSEIFENCTNFRSKYLHLTSVHLMMLINFRCFFRITIFKYCLLHALCIHGAPNPISLQDITDFF